MYVSVPIPGRYSDDENPIEPFAVDVATESCSTLPFTLRVVDGENRYVSLVTVTMSDADFAQLGEAWQEANKKRRVSKENYLEALKVELGLDDYDGSDEDNPKSDDEEQNFCPVCGQPDNCGDCDHTPIEFDTPAEEYEASGKIGPCND